MHPVNNQVLGQNLDLYESWDYMESKQTPCNMLDFSVELHIFCERPEDKFQPRKTFEDRKITWVKYTCIYNLSQEG